jgi:uncharacterized protein (DUF58 family)
MLSSRRRALQPVPRHGFDFVELRDWRRDRFRDIDWAHPRCNSSPLVVRNSAADHVRSIIAADRSASTRCGLDGVPVAVTIARAIATIGMSAVFFQDSIGLITFDAGTNEMGAVRPRIGKGQVIHCLEAYDHGRGLQDMRRSPSLSATLIGFSRKTSLVPVVSDFLFDDPDAVLQELALANNVHDVFVVLADAAYAFELPHVTAGWVEALDVESGRTRLLSRREARGLQARVTAWQDDVAKKARNRGLDVLRLGADQTKFDIALLEWVHERRLRRKR